jgi:hypothetical protein
MFDQINSPDGRRSTSRSPSGLILLGTVHSDPKGFSRTSAFLEQHRSDLVLVEISAFALKFRKEHSSELRKIFLERLRTISEKLKIEFSRAIKHVQITSILRQISIPFEYRASASYAKKTGIYLIGVDYSDFSRRWIETWREMISAENIERLLELESAGPPVCSLYAQAAGRISGEPSRPETRPADPLLWQEREKHMAYEINSALERLNPVRPVYIGGWWHLSCQTSIKTLRELLGIGAASCRLLDRGLIKKTQRSNITNRTTRQ